MDKVEKMYGDILEKLQEICVQKNITYYYLAKATGLSQSSISYMMRGKSKPYLYTILMISDAMDISLQDLIPNADEGTGAEEKRLIHTFRQLTPEKQRLLEIYANMLQEYTGDL